MYIKPNKKITINNETYQILEDSTGKQTLYKINNANELEEAILDFSTLKKVIIELTQPTKARLKRIYPCNIIATLLAIALLSPLALSIIKEMRKITISTNSNICSTSDKNHYKKIIDNNKNLSDDYKAFLYYFAEKTHEVFPEYHNICDQLDDITIEQNNEYINSNHPDAIAVYRSYDNKIIALEDKAIYEYINHEALHSWSVVFANSCQKHQLMIAEVITAQLEWELFGTKSYEAYTKYAKMLSLIVGADKLMDIYATGTFSDLETELSKYCTKEELDANLILLTTLKNEKAHPIDARYKKIDNFFIEMFYKKLSQDINNKDFFTQEEYHKVTEDILKLDLIFEPTYFLGHIYNLKTDMFNKLEEKSYYKESELEKQGYTIPLTEHDLSYISGHLTHHHELHICQKNNQIEYTKLYTLMGANFNYIQNYPNNIPKEDIATIKIYTTEDSTIYFDNIDNYINLTTWCNNTHYPDDTSAIDFSKETEKTLTKKYKIN